MSTQPYSGTKGCAAFNKWRKKNKLTYSMLGAMMGVKGTAIGNWATGFSRPDRLAAALLHVIARIRPEAWLTEEEKKWIQSCESAYAAWVKGL